MYFITAKTLNIYNVLQQKGNINKNTFKAVINKKPDIALTYRQNINKNTSTSVIHKKTNINIIHFPSLSTN